MTSPGAPSARQFVSLCRLLIGNALRSGYNATLGGRFSVWRNLIGPMLLLGIVWSFGISESSDPGMALTMLFFSVGTLVVVGILPDTQERSTLHAEIFDARPISPFNRLAARIVLLIVFGVISAVSAGTPTLVALAFRGRISPLQALAQWCAIVLCGATASVVWLYLYIALNRFIARDRLRRAIQLTQIFVMLSLTMGSTLSLIAPQVHGFLQGARGLIAWVPFTWYASVFAFHANSLGPRVGAILLSVAVFATPFSRWMRAGHTAALGTQSSPRKLSHPVGVRLLDVFARRPWLGRFVKPQALAVARAIVLAVAREELGRNTRSAQKFGLLAVFVFACINRDDTGFLMTAYLGFAAIPMGVAFAGRSAYAEAAWLFVASPLRARDIVRGIRLSVLVDSFPLPFALVALEAAMTFPKAEAAILVAAFWALTRFGTSVLLTARPVIPLSEEQKLLTPLTSGLVALIPFVPFLVTFGLVTLPGVAPFSGLYIVGLVVAFTAGVDRIATSRTGRIITSARASFRQQWFRGFLALVGVGAFSVLGVSLVARTRNGHIGYAPIAREHAKAVGIACLGNGQLDWPVELSVARRAQSVLWCNLGSPELVKRFVKESSERLAVFGPCSPYDDTPDPRREIVFRRRQTYNVVSELFRKNKLRQRSLSPDDLEKTLRAELADEPGQIDQEVVTAFAKARGHVEAAEPEYERENSMALLQMVGLGERETCDFEKVSVMTGPKAEGSSVSFLLDTAPGLRLEQLGRFICARGCAVQIQRLGQNARP